MKKKVLVTASVVMMIVLVLLILFQTLMVEENLRVNKKSFAVAVNKTMNNVISDLNRENIKKYIIATDKNFFERYKRIEAINERMKDIHRENPMLVNYIEKCKADSSYFKNLSCMDSCVVAEYCGLSKQRDILRDTSFSLNHYADYFLQYTTKYNILDINEIDYTLLDSLIKENLIKNDIFEFPAVAVFDITQKEVLYCNNNTEINNLRKSGFKYEYAIGGLRNENVVYISVYFHTFNYFIKNNPYIYLFISIFLVIVIVCIFTMMLKMILNRQKLDEMKSGFISNMNHELKTPISTISLACEMLQLPETKEDKASIDTYLRIIAEENNRLKGLVDIVLQQSKMTDNKMVLSKSSIDIHEIVENAKKNINFVVSNKRGKISTKLRAENPIMLADKVHITNMIYNLVDNAIKYSPDVLDIGIEVWDSQNSINISVTDKGLGIPKDKIKHIFDKFYRVDTGNVHNVKGFGIGLSYVKEIVQMHNGKIDVKSAVGKGTSFIVVLPRK